MFQNVQFLSRKGIAFRGNNNEGNFERLMKLSGKVDPRITSWMEKKKREKYFHCDTQNEIIILIAFITLREIAKNINDSMFYSIMAHKVIDCSNKEQFVIYFRRVDKGFDTHEDFIEIYNVDNIKADTFVTIIKDVLIRLNIPLSNARRQCYKSLVNRVPSVATCQHTCVLVRFTCQRAKVPYGVPMFQIGVPTWQKAWQFFKYS